MIVESKKIVYKYIKAGASEQRHTSVTCFFSSHSPTHTVNINVEQALQLINYQTIRPGFRFKTRKHLTNHRKFVGGQGRGGNVSNLLGKSLSFSLRLSYVLCMYVYVYWMDYSCLFLLIYLLLYSYSNYEYKTTWLSLRRLPPLKKIFIIIFAAATC